MTRRRIESDYFDFKRPHRDRPITVAHRLDDTLVPDLRTIPPDYLPLYGVGALLFRDRRYQLQALRQGLPLTMQWAWDTEIRKSYSGNDIMEHAEKIAQENSSPDLTPGIFTVALRATLGDPSLDLAFMSGRGDPAGIRLLFGFTSQVLHWFGGGEDESTMLR
jgi:hypothetical protein